MRFTAGVNTLLGLFVLVQLSFGTKTLKERDEHEIEKGFEFQKLTEHLIEKVLHLFKDYHAKVRNIYNCVPDKLVPASKEILKRSTDCLDEIEEELDEMRVTKNDYEKLFQRCVEQERKEVANLTQNIDPTANLCPKKEKEKTYQIDITTILRKAFDINFKKGLKIIKKTIILGTEESTFKDEDRQTLRREDGWGTEKPEPSIGEDTSEVLNLNVPEVVESIEEEDSFDKAEEFATTQAEMETQSRNSEESDESENDEPEASVKLSEEIST